eukprot:8618304-Pyramimonas_sp.AAC.2
MSYPSIPRRLFSGLIFKVRVQVWRHVVGSVMRVSKATWYHRAAELCLERLRAPSTSKHAPALYYDGAHGLWELAAQVRPFPSAA